MATINNATEWRISADLATVTMPAAQAGAKLVCVSYGGAVVTAKLGVGGTAFTKRAPTSLSGFEVACQDIVAVGGETLIEMDLNGNENVDGVIFEFAAGHIGDFLTGAAATGLTPDAQSRISPGDLTVAAQAVVFSAWIKGETSDFSLARAHWGIEPASRLASRRANTNASFTRFFGQCGVGDVEAGTHAVRSSTTITGGSSQAGAWAYEDLSGVPTHTFENAVVRENSLPGSNYTSWLGATTNSNIAGFADATSYLPGDTVNFKVDSDNVGFTVEINRLGGYGYLLFGGRRVATVAGTPAVQPAATTDALGAASCAWSTTATWDLPDDATPGVYLVNFRRTDNTSFVAQGVFIVRSEKPATRQADSIGLKLSDVTWQAYNGWGARTDAGTTFTGRSIYGPGNSVQLGDRAFAVSFDRPYATQTTFSQTWLLDAEIGMIHFLEQNGYPVDYYSSVDIEKDPTIPSMYGVFIGTGHDEYVSEPVWSALRDARDAGTHLWIDGGNFALWRVRFDVADTDRRNIICYKDSHDTEGFDGTTKYDPGSYTGTWRDSRTVPGGVSNPDRRPESALAGQWFIGNGPQALAIQVPDTYKDLPCWRGTDVAALGSGATYTSPITSTIGYEFDYVKTSESTTPTNLVLLAHRDVTLTGAAASDNGETYAGSGTFRWGASLYRAASGALVFSAGTWRWANGLSRFRANSHDVNGDVDLALQQCTVNILRDMGIEPVTLLDAVRNGVADDLVDPGAAAEATAYGLSLTKTETILETFDAEDAGVWEGWSSPAVTVTDARLNIQYLTSGPYLQTVADYGLTDSNVFAQVFHVPSNGDRTYFGFGSPDTLTGGDQILTVVDTNTVVFREIVGGVADDTPETQETFDNYPPDVPWGEGTGHGPWTVAFVGANGQIVPVDVGGSEGRVLQLEATDEASTSSSLVVTSDATSGDVSFTTRVRTVAQLHTSPQPWEVAWFIWNHTESAGLRKFYYVALKTNGFELGKVDQTIALPGGQRFLFTDSTPFTVGTWYDLEVTQTGSQIQVWVDGILRADFTDGVGSGGTPAWGTPGEAVFTAGAAGMYHEDARVQFADVSPVEVVSDYDDTMMRWWRIRHSGSTVYWETSENGADWTIQRNKSAGFTPSEGRVKFGTSNSIADQTESPARFDNVNGGTPMSIFGTLSLDLPALTAAFTGGAEVTGTLGIALPAVTGLLQGALTGRPTIVGDITGPASVPRAATGVGVVAHSATGPATARTTTGPAVSRRVDGVGV